MRGRTGVVGLLAIAWALGCAMERDEGVLRVAEPAARAPVAVQDRAPPVWSDRGEGTARYGEPRVPLSGGTLVVTRDGRWAVMSDPDADVVRVVDLAALELHREIALEEGDEPGRLAEDAEGRVHVLLRRGGAVASFDPSGGAASRRAICGAPRGIAYDAASDSLHVACAGGELVTLPVAGSEPTRLIALDPDLRDVVALGDRLYVSRLRTAEVLVLSADGAVEDRVAPPTLVLPRRDLTATFGAAVAWRMIGSARGPLLSYQRVLTTPVDTRPGGYGTADSCTQSILHTGLAHMTPQGLVPLRSLGHATLPVDVAVSPDGSHVALAFAGNVASDIVHTAPPVGVYEAAALEGIDESPCASPVTAPGIRGRAVAVAYDPLGRLVIQVTSPPQLVVIGQGVAAGGMLRLAEGPSYEAGHHFFHATTPSGLACASCHPEGGDDGVVWTFREVGRRRTQTLFSGILSTAPFHWDGTAETMHDIVQSTLTNRMSGPSLDPDEMAAVAHYVDTLEPPTLGVPVDADAVARGEAIFASEAAACVSCHSGPLGTDNASHLVRSAVAPIQTPALVALLARAPYMHDGCARGLREAVLACGDPAGHGGAASLAESELDDLVAYLRTR